MRNRQIRSLNNQFAAGQYVEVSAEYHKIINQGYSEPGGIENLAVSLHSIGSSDLAVRLLNYYYLQSQDSYLLELSAEINEDLHNYEQAYSNLKQVKELDPQLEHYLPLLINSIFVLDLDFESELSNFALESSLESDLVMCSYRRLSSEHFGPDLQEICNSKVDQRDLIDNLAIVNSLLELRLYGPSLEVATKMISEQPDFYQPYLYAGIAAMELGEYEQSAIFFETAYQKNRSSLTSWFKTINMHRSNNPVEFAQEIVNLDLAKYDDTELETLLDASLDLGLVSESVLIFEQIDVFTNSNTAELVSVLSDDQPREVSCRFFLSNISSYQVLQALFSKSQCSKDEVSLWINSNGSVD